MNLARQDIANTWNGRGVTSEASKFLNLSEKIPTFGREPFSMGEGNNDYLDTIYNESDHMPVATVSKSYALVQHTEIIDAMSSALDNMNFDLNDINCQYNITDYGERMWLKLMFPDQYNMDPGDGNTLRLQMHALNSVDRTIPLIFRIGWFRIICANGMIRLQQGKISGKRHTPSLADTVIEDYIKGHLDTIDDEVKQYQTMHAEKLALSQNFIDGWVDNTLNRKWGVRLAARAHSIITTGYDGQPSRADEMDDARRLIPSKIRVSKTDRVPGQPEKAETPYDLSNALSWIASHHPTIQTRFDLMNDVPELLRDERIAQALVH